MAYSFLDSNVLVFSIDTKNHPDQAIRAKVIIAEGGVISTQVLNETVNVCLKRLKLPLIEIERNLNDFRQRLTIVPFTEQITFKALTLMKKYSTSWWDALIVSAALENNCDTLITEDLKSFPSFEGRLKVVNPFKI